MLSVWLPDTVSGDTGGTSGGTQGWESPAEVPGLGWGAMAALQATTALCGLQESCLENRVVCWF